MTTRRPGDRSRFGSSLEVKCLFFFGFALAVVLAVSFILYYHLTAKQLDTQNPLMGRLLAEREFILWHFGAVVRHGEDNGRQNRGGASPEMEDYGPNDFIDTMKYQSEMLEGSSKRSVAAHPVSRLIRTAGGTPTPEDELDTFEKNLVARLERSATNSSPTSRVDEQGRYLYYQPLRIDNSCLNCHPQEDSRSALALGSLQGIIQVTIPEPPSRKELTRFWAMLLAAAIVTAFVGLVSFYAVIRWIIIRPLRSLRGVSEAISSGDITKRADITTGDEFETLSVAFNQMLHHLVATQEKLSDMNQELRTKVDELAQQSLKLFETNKIKSDFMATMSHELRTPLNSILGFSEVLGSIDTLSDKQRRYVTNINKSGQTLLNMINDILDMARLEAGRLEARPSQFRIEAVVDAQVDMARPLVDRKNLDITCTIEPNLPQIYQDESRIGQILNNLLSNAIKFTPEGGKISVSVRRLEDLPRIADDGKQVEGVGVLSLAGDSLDILPGFGMVVTESGIFYTRKSENARPNGGFLEIKVSDTGIGISPEDRQIIFEKFRQAGGATSGDRSITREYSGSGLGLSIVRELCRLLEGEIFVSSQLGVGSEFTVILPCEFQRPDVQESPILSDIREFSQTSTGKIPLPGKAQSKPAP